MVSIRFCPTSPLSVKRKIVCYLQKWILLLPYFAF